MNPDLILMGKALLLCLVLMGLPAYLLLRAHPSNRYRWDERNPYRRWCNRCGREQNQYRSAIGPDTWEPMGRPLDPKCPCNKDR